jgi:hypothetical protein
MASPYIYQPLVKEAREIRLLKITSKTSVFHCQISHVSLDERPSYTALSYTCQQNMPEEHVNPEPFICVSGKTLKITKNLEHALGYLHSCNAGSLWIDAFCIDQANLDERGHQVGFMGNLFSRAKKVLIWLGPSSDSSEYAMDFLRLIAQNAQRPDRVEWLENLSKDQANLYGWKALRDLMQLNWWRRAWVIQEYVLAGDTQFVCGACSLDGSQIEAANQLLFDGWQKVYATGNVPFNARVLDPMRNMFELRSRLKCGQQMGLLTCLWMTRDALATDRRDYLFAKLGMMGEKASSLCMPNYYKSLHEIDLRFSQAYIRSEGDLYIICHAGMLLGPTGKLHGCPTGAPRGLLIPCGVPGAATHPTGHHTTQLVGLFPLLTSQRTMF